MDEENNNFEELQLHEDEKGGIVRKRVRSYDTAFKLEAIEYTKKVKSYRGAASNFGVDKQRIKEWMAQEEQLKNQKDSPKGVKRKRLGGGGRHVKYPDLDKKLAVWVEDKRKNKLQVSRKLLRAEATKIFAGREINVSNGWLESFLQRHRFVLRRKTTTAQKPPQNHAEVVAKFLVHIEKRRKAYVFSSISAMDETAVWMDCGGARTLDKIGSKDVSVCSTGHEKMRVTVALTANSDGIKLRPYILVNRKRPIAGVVDQFKGKLIINWAGTIWMNDETTEEYLREIHGQRLFGNKRLLVWDAFKCHRSEATKKAPDVSWNKPFKQRITELYELWMINEDRHEFTKAGNPRPPALEIVLEWICQAWNDLSKEVIVRSFQACGLTTPLDGSGDNRIACFKDGGSIGPMGREMLRKARAEQESGHGIDDDEDAGLSDHEAEVEPAVQELTLEDAEDDEMFLIT